MSQRLHPILSVLSLMSRIPVRLKEAPVYSKAALLVPMVGLVAGLLSCLGMGLGLVLFSPGLLAALCAMLAQYLGFNLFHLDGLLDTADAGGCMGGPERKAEVLKDPRIGSFALFAGFILLAFRAGATASLSGSAKAALWGTLLLAPCAGRLAAMLVAAGGKPAASSGLAAALGPVSAAQAALGYALAALPGALLWAVALGPLAGPLAMLAGAGSAALAGMGIAAWYQKNLGGFTGDALGAAVELGELGVLLVAAIVVP